MKKIFEFSWEGCWHSWVTDSNIPIKKRGDKDLIQGWVATTRCVKCQKYRTQQFYGDRFDEK